MTPLEQLKHCRLLVASDNAIGLVQSPLGQCSAAVRGNLVTEHEHAIAPGVVRIDIVGQESVFMLDADVAKELGLKMEEPDGDQQED